MSPRRFFAYLLLNIVISLGVTAAGIWVWSAYWAPRPTGVPLATAGIVVASTPTPAVAAPEASPSGETPGGATAQLPTTTALSTAAPTVMIYVVQSGDTLGAIAQRFDVSLEDLMAANGLTDPNTLQVGQSLLIPIGGIVPPPTPEPTAATPVLLPTNPADPPRPTATAASNIPLPRLVIREAQNPGQLATEVLLLGNTGGPVNLLGWTLRTETGEAYLFPNLVLFTDGAVYLHTAAGVDTVTDLYWSRTAALWASGATVLLSDPDGNLHARYTIP